MAVISSQRVAHALLVRWTCVGADLAARLSKVFVEWLYFFPRFFFHNLPVFSRIVWLKDTTVKERT